MDVNRQSRDGHCHPPFSLLNKRRNHREQGTREMKPTVIMARAGMRAEVTAAVLNSSCHRKRTLDPASLFHSGRVEWRGPGAGGKPVGKAGWWQSWVRDQASHQVYALFQHTVGQIRKGPYHTGTSFIVYIHWCWAPGSGET